VLTQMSERMGAEH